MKKFCVLTIGRTGSTSLMHALEKFDDIALPSRDTVCVDNELLHAERIADYMEHYAPYASEKIIRPQQLINAFYACHAEVPYAGFKSMPNRHPNYFKFITRSDIQFITLTRRDLPSLVASFISAMENGTWRRNGEDPPTEWKFDIAKHGKAVVSNVAYVLKSYAALNCVPNAIRLSYEGLCDPSKEHLELNKFFGRIVNLADPKSPTLGENYVENWAEFKSFVLNTASGMMQKARTPAAPSSDQS
jgi:hypothetical protein